MRIDIFARTKDDRVLPFLLAATTIWNLSTIAAVAQTSDWGESLKLCPANSELAAIGETRKFYVNICYKGIKARWYVGVDKSNPRNRITRPVIEKTSGVNRKWTARYGDTRYEVNDSEDLRVYKGKRLLFKEDFIMFHIVGD